MTSFWTDLRSNAEQARAMARSLGLGEWSETEEGQRCLLDLVGVPGLVLRRSKDEEPKLRCVRSA
jgi:hypothetical protein